MTGHGQRKKKPQDEPQASGIKLREAEFYFTEGEKFFILEDYAKALLYYQRTLEITPENATVHYKIAEVLARSNRQEDLQKAALSIENALKLERQNKYFYLLAANIYNSLTKFDKAAEIYETLIREVKGSEEYLYELAAVYQYAGKPDEAIKTYNRAESILGINDISSIQKQRLYLEQGKSKEAIAEGEKLINAFPDEERYVMGFAEVLSQNGFRNDAVRYLDKFVQQNPEAGNAKMLLAGLYRETQQEEKSRPLLLELFDDPSVELTSKLIMLGTYNTELAQRKAKNTTDQNLQDFVLSLYQKLEKNHGNDPRVHIVGGDLYLSVEKNREAQQEYEKAIDLGDVNFEVWKNLLYLETQAGQWDNVIRHADEALEYFPNQGMLHYFNGYAHFRKRNYAEAIVSLDQAKRLSSSNTSIVGEINSMLGDAYNANKDYDKSDKAYEEALLINPDNSAVLNNYSYYLALRKVNLEKAEKMSAHLVKNNPDNPTFLDTYAWVLFTREKYKEARKTIERAISTGKATATHFEHYGDILFKLGDVNGAVQQWEKARGLNANSEVLNKKIANRKIYE
ncbi:Tetratricopeptide repeat-containing protein [Ohtaekwangia koreensis]|uniref:Tetratricopeptide repeat-containing protein n=2 Tax=Ohtaekwangia koreensis TaxID=688867 RepID=A0A1T5IKT7_9BACT|nr:Tetratricopeptide repeat-containing protein [Ohtaekwangia koreensis]